MKVETILDQIDLGSMALPEFQRGYVLEPRPGSGANVLALPKASRWEPARLGDENGVR